jgi:hypothetical protein
MLRAPRRARKARPARPRERIGDHGWGLLASSQRLGWEDDWYARAAKTHRRPSYRRQPRL